MLHSHLVGKVVSEWLGVWNYTGTHIIAKGAGWPGGGKCCFPSSFGIEVGSYMDLVNMVPLIHAAGTNCRVPQTQLFPQSHTEAVENGCFKKGIGFVLHFSLL